MLAQFGLHSVQDLFHGKVSIRLGFKSCLKICYLILQYKYLLIFQPEWMKTVFAEILLSF